MCRRLNEGKSGVCGEVRTESLACLKRSDGEEGHQDDGGCSWLNSEDRLGRVEIERKKTVN